MNLNLKRSSPIGQAVFGTLLVDNIRQCSTLERLDVQIPCGTYSIEITYSPRFNRPLPLLDGVPGRSDIRIHAGNWPKDTEGCLLVGSQISPDSQMILYSLVALNSLVAKIQAALDAGDDVQIEVSD